jgi:hypothetical protein
MPRPAASRPPAFVLFTDLPKAGPYLAALAERYPVISKPLDLCCSIGVRVLRDQDALEAHLDELAAAPVLLEQCVSGREFSVETIMIDAAPGLREVLVLKDHGAELGPLTDSFGRAVTALFDAPDQDRLECSDSEVRAAVRISVR